MDSLFIDALAVTPQSLRIYEELLDIELSDAAISRVFPKKPDTLSYAFAKDGISMGYYKILSEKPSALQGFTVFTLHKQ